MADEGKKRRKGRERQRKKKDKRTSGVGVMPLHRCLLPFSATCFSLLCRSVFRGVSPTPLDRCFLPKQVLSLWFGLRVPWLQILMSLLIFLPPIPVNIVKITIRSPIIAFIFLHFIFVPGFIFFESAVKFYGYKYAFLLLLQKSFVRERL